MTCGSEGRRPPSWSDLRRAWDRRPVRESAVAAYTSGELSFIPGLLPEQAVALPVGQVLQILGQRLGPRLARALSAEATDPERPAAGLDPDLLGPAAGRADGGWLRRANMVGINVRTIGSLWSVVPYSLTLPAAQDALHLLPIWEPGVVRSLYGPCSWCINPELYSARLHAEVPHLDDVQRQLRAVVNLLHACGRTVGMDVIPHTDR